MFAPAATEPPTRTTPPTFWRISPPIAKSPSTSDESAENESANGGSTPEPARREPPRSTKTPACEHSFRQRDIANRTGCWSLTMRNQTTPRRGSVGSLPHRQPSDRTARTFVEADPADDPRKNAQRDHRQENPRQPTP